VDSNSSYKCRNIECQKEFDSPKVVSYFVCPFCETRVENEENGGNGCLHFFGYLGERKVGEDIPVECVECRRSIECMLKSLSSRDAAEQIQKWYK
jgi:DNA-directed RNA polymerase subunit RPC12/RpoP